MQIGMYKNGRVACVRPPGYMQYCASETATPQYLPALYPNVNNLLEENYAFCVEFCLWTEVQQNSRKIRLFKNGLYKTIEITLSFLFEI